MGGLIDGSSSIVWPVAKYGPFAVVLTGSRPLLPATFR